MRAATNANARTAHAAEVDISTKAALREMILPVVLAIVVPLSVGFILGPEALEAY